MDTNDPLFIAVTQIQETVSSLRTDISVITTKQEELLSKSVDRTRRGEILEDRLRSVESILLLHKSYFAILGIILVICVGGIIDIMINGSIPQ